MADLKRKRNTKKETHYVDNEKLFEHMKIFCAEFKEWVECGSESGQRPRPSEYIGECLLAIAENLGTKPNFANYTYKDEMISDGIENCILYMGNFDPNKYDNPFSYFTTIIYYAFLRRINKEKKQAFIKMQAFEAMDHDKTMIEKMKADGIIDADSSNPYADYFSMTNQDVESFAQKKPRKKRKNPKGTEEL